MKKKHIVVFNKEIESPAARAVIRGVGGVFGAVIAGAVLLVVGLSLALAGAAAVIFGTLALAVLGTPLAVASARRRRRRRSDLPAGGRPELDEEGRPIKFVEARVKDTAAKGKTKDEN